MGIWGIKTKKDREHEMALQKEAQEHDEKMQRDFLLVPQLGARGERND